MLDILNNPMAKSMLIGQIKKAFKQHGLTAVVLTIDEAGEAQIEPYIAPVSIVPTAELSAMQEIYLKYIKGEIK